MGFFSRVLIPRSIRKALHPIRTTKRAVIRAVVPRPLRKVRHAIWTVTNPIDATGMAIENAAVHAVRGSGRRRRRSKPPISKKATTVTRPRRLSARRPTSIRVPARRVIPPPIQRNEPPVAPYVLSPLAVSFSEPERRDGGLAFSLRSIDRPYQVERVDIKGKGMAALRARSGSQLVVANIKVRNAGERNVDPCCSFDLGAVLVDADQRLHTPVRDLFSVSDGARCHDVLPPGGSSDESIIFEIPAGLSLIALSLWDPNEPRVIDPFRSDTHAEESVVTFDIRPAVTPREEPAVSDAPPWNDEGWKEPGDSEWAAGCRWLQSWWRATVLEVPPGERTTRDHRLVGSMLPLGSSQGLNFLNAGIGAAVEARLASPEHAGIIQEDRLFRNLLSSQPACFNLFGPFVADPGGLLSWVQTIDDAATGVTLVRFEWAPDRKEHFDSGSAFDALVEYQTGKSKRFLGIECKYAEDLSKSSITVRPPFFEWTTPAHGWKEGAAERLDHPKLRQFWLNTCLVQSLAEKDGRYDRGTSVIVACAADTSAEETTIAVAQELLSEWGLRWSPYERVLDATQVPELTQWKERFIMRYLDFAPVRDLLGSSDPRRNA